MRIILTLCVAYVLGSVLPADLFARARGVDIRSIGTGNPGTSNAFQQLGLVAGLATGAYDMSVGLASMWLGSALGLSAGWMYLAGLTAVVGHCFPIFFRFRGGQGMAASAGMLLFGLGVSLERGWLTVGGLAALAALAVGTFALTRSPNIVGLVMAPLLIAELALGRPEWQFALFMTVLAVWIWIVQFDLARKRHSLRLPEPLRAAVAKMRTPMR